jgi:hypothetical protein
MHMPVLPVSLSKLPFVRSTTTTRTRIMEGWGMGDVRYYCQWLFGVGGGVSGFDLVGPRLGANAAARPHCVHCARIYEAEVIGISYQNRWSDPTMYVEDLIFFVFFVTNLDNLGFIKMSARLCSLFLYEVWSMLPRKSAKYYLLWRRKILFIWRRKILFIIVKAQSQEKN